VCVCVSVLSSTHLVRPAVVLTSTRRYSPGTAGRSTRPTRRAESSRSATATRHQADVRRELRNNRANTQTHTQTHKHRNKHTNTSRISRYVQSRARISAPTDHPRAHEPQRGAAALGQRPLGPRPGLRAFELEMSVNATRSLAFGAMPLNRASADPAGASPAATTQVNVRLGGSTHL
jgi:hypothetical protein